MGLYFERLNTQTDTRQTTYSRRTLTHYLAATRPKAKPQPLQPSAQKGLNLAHDCQPLFLLLLLPAQQTRKRTRVPKLRVNLPPASTCQQPVTPAGVRLSVLLCELPQASACLQVSTKHRWWRLTPSPRPALNNGPMSVLVWVTFIDCHNFSALSTAIK